MKREWKPGDVAMVNDCTRPDRPWEAATCTAARTPDRETTWRLHRNGGEVWGSVSDARLLVVIDPEDREQVERLWVTLRDGLALRSRDNLTEALREFANPTPPKPDEPTGLGAVVEDADGTPWIRVEPHIKGNSIHTIAWRSRVPNAAPKEYSWPNVAAVRVLSEGVQP